MTCKDAVDFLADYLEGNLAWPQRLVFELHLLLCRNCRRYLESYSRTVELTKGLNHESSTAGIPPIPEELVRAILAARRSGDGPTTGDNFGDGKPTG
jgi:predicted anti-sigma-YlaC factor YlaD